MSMVPLRRMAKVALRRTPLHGWLLDRQFARWQRDGRPLPPPPAVKERHLRGLARRFALRRFVETGTWRGDMIDALARDFDRLYSIELSPEFHAQAQRRFAGQRRIELLQGDSGEVLAGLLPRLDGPALFWLDGHYSGGATARGERSTPILQELQRIYARPDPGHVIVIDDARLFGSDPEYPTLDDLRRRLADLRPGAQIDVEVDAIRVIPPPAGA